MAKQRSIEVLVGAFMAAALVALFFLAMKVSNLGTSPAADGYRVTARFANAGSLKVRAPVSMAGVRVGRVEAIRFDKKTYEAVVTMRIENGVDTIPEDTFANIFTAGLLGEQYVGLEPGGSEDFVRDGDELTQTQSALILEQMIGQFLFSKAEEGGK